MFEEACCPPSRNRVRLYASLLGLAFEQLGQAGKWREGRRPIALLSWGSLGGRVRRLVSLMLIVMAVEAEEFPVTAVRRIVVVVVVFVMDRELAQFLSVEFATAAGADPGKELERLIAEGVLSCGIFP